MLLIEESWFILVLSWCVVTEVAWLLDEVWITDEPFVVAMRGEFLHNNFCLFFPVMCLLLYLPHLTDFLN